MNGITWGYGTRGGGQRVNMSQQRSQVARKTSGILFLPVTCTVRRPPPPPRDTTEDGRRFNFKVTLWNVDGLRAWVKKGGLEWVQADAPDVLCIQETKCGAESVPEELRSLGAFPHQHSPSDRLGYSGVGLLSRTKPLAVTYGMGDPELDAEGRVLTAEFPALRVVYVPNSRRGLGRLSFRQAWDERFRSFVSQLDRSKPVAICGDLNVAHQPLDLRNPSGNKRSPGFTREEREAFRELLGAGFLDSFRVFNPSLPNAFTFWTYLSGARARNVGWRLDYCLWSQRGRKDLCDSRIEQRAQGSDHCPVGIYLALEGAG
ncbi:DNA-(apurinic or apyrimidinic site) endonuclease-like [Colius striatus]|uniref:DNA-(apurinic or apyrimidinic site) endonuclease-like n=1 Tax=Colius striatus TaxID=57412 RepID=UPI002B1CEE1C|nr:DNA-(apurinic or apyrimidinic site) endonuclease-like [Colius striatus]